MCFDQGMTQDEALLSVGDVAELSSVTVRTLQYYDRIGLLPAERKTDGKRGYTPAHLERLQQIRLMQEMGMNLEQVQKLLDQHQNTQPWRLYANQAEVLEMAELRLRCQRSIASALAEVLHTHPKANISAEVMRAVMNFENTLLAYRDIDFPHDTDATDYSISEIIDLYLRWKTLAVRALVLQHNEIAVDSPSGTLLGEAWQDYLDFAATTRDGGKLAEHSQNFANYWPEADRQLFESTKTYLGLCHQHYIHRGGAGVSR